MENEEPNNGSQDGTSDKSHESVPGQIPNALLEPVRPNSEEQEEKDKADEEHKLQLHAEPSA